jgi:hypothetical protein
MQSISAILNFQNLKKSTKYFNLITLHPLKLQLNLENLQHHFHGRQTSIIILHNLFMNMKLFIQIKDEIKATIEIPPMIWKISAK